MIGRSLTSMRNDFNCLCHFKKMTYTSHDAIMTSSWRPNNVATSFGRHNIFTSCVHWDITRTLHLKIRNFEFNIKTRIDILRISYEIALRWSWMLQDRVGVNSGVGVGVGFNSNSNSGVGVETSGVGVGVDIQETCRSWSWSWNSRSWSWSWYSRDLPELELELKLLELELELKLKLSGDGVGIGVEFFFFLYIYTYIQVLFWTYNFETVPIILCLLTR